ncbi:hypothetical protein J2Y73_003937 [Peribacillus frigoritolerans]|jgi:hypothetical protein|uniref:Uncharacterized protein n=1 Tax=Peribacillus simplex TaxID=1478 RepID=A0AAN2TU68_9BACI|nr:hypothetical protein [Peribacillus frigoritolerans]MDP9739873.1 hypothetical protein [Bacillus sp. B2I3]CEG33927.1 hypothetical protein BN1180_04112 [Peribacillus simplex]
MGQASQYETICDTFFIFREILTGICRFLVNNNCGLHHYLIG